eukprot:1193319-Prorocentrum_minimum.AAC.1
MLRINQTYCTVGHGYGGAAHLHADQHLIGLSKSLIPIILQAHARFAAHVLLEALKVHTTRPRTCSVSAAVQVYSPNPNKNPTYATDARVISEVRLDAPVTGSKTEKCPLPSRDRSPLQAYAPSPRTIGSRIENFGLNNLAQRSGLERSVQAGPRGHIGEGAYSGSGDLSCKGRGHTPVAGTNHLDGGVVEAHDDLVGVDLLPEGHGRLQQHRGGSHQRARLKRLPVRRKGCGRRKHGPHVRLALGRLKRRIRPLEKVPPVQGETAATLGYGQVQVTGATFAVD